MPTYQYACTACGHQLEAVQSFTDDPLTQCPECEGRLRKLFGSVGVVFKGPGFYRTDSRANGKAAGSGNGKANGKPESSSGAEKPAPAAKPADKASGDKAPATASS